MLVSKKPCTPNTNINLHVTSQHDPNASRRKNIIVRVGHFRVCITLGIWISCCLSHVFLCWVAKGNAVSGGIWAHDVLIDF